MVLTRLFRRRRRHAAPRSRAALLRRHQRRHRRPHGVLLHPDLYPRPLGRQLRLHLLHHRLPPGPRNPDGGDPPCRRRRGGRATYSCGAPRDADAGGGARWGRAAGHADGRAAAGHGGGEPARPPRALP